MNNIFISLFPPEFSKKLQNKNPDGAQLLIPDQYGPARA
jgi:hypothetical protein